MPLIRLRDYTTTPGGRERSGGPWSAEEWRDEHLVPAFVEAWAGGDTLTVDLDGCAGFAACFIDEAFGGLVEAVGLRGAEVLEALEVHCRDEPRVLEDIERHLTEEMG